MITSLRFEVPEIVTGLAGLTVIVISVIHSILANKKDEKALVTKA